MINCRKAPLKGQVTIPGDKSISHRAVMFSALADGKSKITNFLQGADCLSTIRCFKQLGIHIDNNPALGTVIVHGKGLHGLQAPDNILDVGNSGTTMRLISGILSGQSFPVTLIGDESICRRPMNRILTPLIKMGADIASEQANGCAPLLINHNINKAEKTGKYINKAEESGKYINKLNGIHYLSPVASAQVKSCVILAGLYADSETSVTEPYLTRNHTELMLAQLGAQISTSNNTVTIQPEPMLLGNIIDVPGDISSAAYFIAAGLIVPNSEILIRNVGINPTRDGILKVCAQMGADITLENITVKGQEPVADLLVRHSELQGTSIIKEIIPTLIDEIPIIAIMACFAKGRTVIKDAAELKFKESDRISVMVGNLRKMGADITATEDGMIINGGKPLHGSSIDTKLDHRIAMSFAVASLMAEGKTELLDSECVNISYPGFYEDLAMLAR